MDGILGPNFALYGCTGPGTTWTNDMNVVMNLDAGAGLIAQHVNLQSGVLPISHCCSRNQKQTGNRKGQSGPKKCDKTIS